MDYGSVYNTSAKQKINRNFSAMAEVISTDDCMSQMMWSKYCLGTQEHTHDHPLQQGNNSAMLLEINDQLSSGKKQSTWKYIIL